MSNFWQRAITGTVFVAVLVAFIKWTPLAFAALLLPVALLGLQEFYTITKRPKTNIPVRLMYIIAAAVYLLMVSIRLFQIPPSSLALAVPLFSVVLISELFRKEKRPINNIAYSLFGILYIVLPFGLLTYIQLDESGALKSSWVLLAFFCSLWANDTGAYLIGRAIGKTPLFARISPKKTWEGFIGGLFFCCLTGYLFSHIDPFLTAWEWMGFSVIIGVFGTLGDLIESMIKRNYQVKDSGTILPGHGGILDRFDGIFLAAPMIITYLELLKAI